MKAKKEKRIILNVILTDNLRSNVWRIHIIIFNVHGKQKIYFSQLYHAYEHNITLYRASCICYGFFSLLDTLLGKIPGCATACYWSLLAITRTYVRAFLFKTMFVYLNDSTMPRLLHVINGLFSLRERYFSNDTRFIVHVKTFILCKPTTHTHICILLWKTMALTSYYKFIRYYSVNRFWRPTSTLPSAVDWWNWFDIYIHINFKLLSLICI